MTETVTKQTLEIRDWHPRTNPNGSNARRHWSVIRRNHDIDRDMAWASARQAGWRFVPGKVRLTITLVYSRKYRVDADNLAARCKGLIDGLKTQYVSISYGGGTSKDHVARHGFFTDDSTEYMELTVRSVVEPGVKAVRIELEPV